MTAFPKLLDASLREVRSLIPLSYKLTDKLTPLSMAYITLQNSADIHMRDFVELFTEDGSAGVFRVTNIRIDGGGVAELTLQHGLCTLSDHMHPGESTETGSLHTLLTKVLSNQSRWTLGTVAVPDSEELTWECTNTNDLEGLLTIMKELPGYYLDFDQTRQPWVLHVLAKPMTVSCEARFDRNLTDAQIEYDSTEMCTCAYADGLEEPIYADTISTWGAIERQVSVDEELGEAFITKTVNRYLEKTKEPRVTITLTALELSRLTGEPFDHFRKGMLCRCILPEMTAVQRIEDLERPDPIGEPQHVILTLASTQDDLSAAVAGLVVDVRHVNQLYQKLAKNLRIEAETIEILAAEIELKATKAELDGVSSRITQAEIDINELFGQLSLKVSYAEFESAQQETVSAINQVFVQLDAVQASIDLWAGTLDEFGNRLDSAELKMDGLEKSIEAAVKDLEGDISQLRIDIDSIAASVKDNQGKIAALELSLTDLEARVVLKAEYDEDKNAILTLISNAEESIATLEAKHGERIAALELYTSDLESRVVLKAEYEENRKADLQLIANANESIATLEAEHDGRLAALELKTNDLESSVVLKAEYDENREADLQLISNAQESVATLAAQYGDQIAALELRADEQGSLIAAKADLILLDGYVKADALETEVLKILEYAWAGDMDIVNLVASSINTEFLSTDALLCDTINGGTAATQEWVIEQGYLKYIPGGYATESWVIEQGYAKSSDVASTLTNFVMKTELDGYATESWVEDKGYLTEVPSGYATQDWVAENFSKASVAYKPTAIERYGSVSGTSIPVRALNESGAVLLTGTVDAGDVYSSGASYGFTGGYNMAISGAIVELDGSTVKVYSPDGGIAGPTLDISDNLTASYNSGYADAKPTAVSRVATYISTRRSYDLTVTVTSANGAVRIFNLAPIDATGPYNAGKDVGYILGYDAAKEEATLSVSGTRVVVTFGDGTAKSIDLEE